MRTLLAAAARRPAPAPTWFTVKPYNQTLDAPVVAATTTVSAYGTDVIGAGKTRITYPDSRLRFAGLLPNAGSGRVVNALMAAQAPFALHATVTGADQIGLHLDGSGSDPTHGILVSIDGHPTTEAPIALTSASILLELPSTGAHVIRVDIAGTGFAALDLPAGATVAAPRYRGPTLMVYGDSWIQGASYDADGNHSNLLHMAWQTGRLLDVPCAVAGVGGSGYTDTSPTGYGSDSRLDQVQAVAPDYLVVFGSINDNGHAETTTRAAAVYADLATRLPNTKVIVCGPQSYNDASNAGSGATTRDRVKAAADAASNVLAFIDPIAETWGYGTGNSTAPAGNGNADVIHNGLNLNHLTLAGNRYYAERLATAIEAATA